jgi:hypothetical protein
MDPRKASGGRVDVRGGSGAASCGSAVDDDMGTGGTGGVGTDFFTDLRLAKKLVGFEVVESLDDAEVVRLGVVFFRPAAPSATVAAKGLPEVASPAFVGLFGVVFFKPAAPKATATIKGFPDGVALELTVDPRLVFFKPAAPKATAAIKGFPDGVALELTVDPRLVFFKPALPSDTAAANELLCPPMDDADEVDGVAAFKDP